jgi:hypothetical protein
VVASYSGKAGDTRGGTTPRRTDGRRYRDIVKSTITSLEFIGVRPDFTIEVREDIVRETDGPTLVHAIQSLHGAEIYLPRRNELRPARELLETRYERFRETSVIESP